MCSGPPPWRGKKPRDLFFFRPLLWSPRPHQALRPISFEQGHASLFPAPGVMGCLFPFRTNQIRKPRFVFVGPWGGFLSEVGLTHKCTQGKVRGTQSAGPPPSPLVGEAQGTRRKLFWVTGSASASPGE